MNYSVFFNDLAVGTLIPDGARVRYAYQPGVVAAGQPAISIRLPVQGGEFTHEDANPFFANLLPEDEYRRVLARMVGVSDRNVAGLLGAIGGECAGAVSIWPESGHPPDPPEYVPLTDADVHGLFRAADQAERLQLVRDGRLSLAGGMEKLCLRRREDSWDRGRAGAPTTHILKWAPASLPDLNYNEVFCLELLREAGLPVVESYIDGEDTPVLIVRRFDRVVQPDESIALLHQEDLCQATATDPGQKYEAEGGPGFGTCATVLRDHARVPARELALLVRWAVANFVIGNCDAHGKNLALLYEPDDLRLAPFYDLASTLAYESLSRKLAMAIGGERRVLYVQRRHWERFAVSIQVPFRAVRGDALGLSDAVEDAIPRVQQRLTARYGPQTMFATVPLVVAKQIARLRASLSTAP